MHCHKRLVAIFGVLHHSAPEGTLIAHTGNWRPNQNDKIAISLLGYNFELILLFPWERYVKPFKEGNDFNWWKIDCCIYFF